jgi:6-phosphogluconate dehydrogenase
MKIKLIGLGKMGLNLALNLKDHKHEVLGYAPSEKTRNLANQKGIATKNSLQELLKNEEASPRVVWLLIPNQVVDETLESMLPYLKQGDIVVDGGNSNFNLSIARYHKLKQKGIHFVDIGTSGGTQGAREGACLMVGGEKAVFDQLEPVLKDVSTKEGYAYMGSPGAGHFVKMVHNGIEYGMMQAIGEGFDLLQHSPFTLNYKDIATVWNHGSIIESSLMGNIVSALQKDQNLEKIEGKVDDSGEGMWMVQEALKWKVSMPVITNALFARYKSKDEQKFSEKVVAAMRGEFGGHKVYQK